MSTASGPAADRDPAGQLPYRYWGRPAPTNTLAILSLVFAFVFFPLGLAFGFVAKSQIRRTGEEGAGLATAGIAPSIVLPMVFLLLVLATSLGSFTEPTLTNIAPP